MEKKNYDFLNFKKNFCYFLGTIKGFLYVYRVGDVTYFVGQEIINFTRGTVKVF